MSPAPRPRVRHKKEWSKLLTLSAALPFFVVLLAALAAVPALFRAQQYSEACQLLMALLGAAAAPVAVAFGFYFWKSKAENLVKMAREMKTDGIDPAVVESIVDTDEIGG